jgi:spoIIIJ-associated protein
LESLGVADDTAEVEVLEEPRAGFLGRMKGTARVRARVRPTQARQKLDRRDRKRGRETGEATKSGADEATNGEPRAQRGSRGRNQRNQRAANNGESAVKTKAPVAEAPSPVNEPSDTAPTADSASSDGRGRNGKQQNGHQRNGQRPKQAKPTTSSRPSQQAHDQEPPMSAEQVGEEAVRFMNGLVSAFGLSGSAELVEQGDDLEVRVHGDNLGLLVGPRGTTLQAVQDLVRVAAQRRIGDHDTRLRVDIGGYRERRREALGRFAEQMAAEVKNSGVARVLEPMSSADRKVIHDVLSGDEGIVTRSEGEDPQRRVVIAPANG